ncbi:VWA domain-containing protein [Candidatus Saccharibacteria bacterium]|nr:VWA domain-containing protein [Candidatus Saccharibacteria bacterium]
MIFRPIIPIAWIMIAAVLLFGFALFCLIRKTMRHGYIFRRIIIIALILVAFLRPMVGNESVERLVSDLNLFFVVDNSGSMATKDMEGGERYRYEVAKADIKNIIRMFPGARYSMTVLDYNVYQSLPLTTDASMATAAGDAIRPRKSNATAGTDLSDLLEFATKRIVKYNKRNPDRRSVIFILTDGEESNEKLTELPEQLKQALSTGAVIGYGTTAGGKVHRVSNTNEILENEFILESTLSSEYHISKLNETNLNNMASKLGLRYIKRDDTGELPKDLENYFWENAKNTDSTTGKMDLYWAIALIVIALLLWDATVVAHKLALERKAVK